MKSIALALVMFASTQVFAGNVELGKYKALDKDTKSIEANFELKEDKSVILSIRSEDVSVTCKGYYNVAGNSFTSTVKCDHPLLPDATSVVIDVTNVTPAGLRSPTGVEVAVVIDVLGDEPVLFMLKKAD